MRSKNIFKKICSFAEERVQENGAQYRAFGLFVVFTYPIWYFFWIYFSAQPYSNLSLRIAAVTLCLILVLNKYWPKALKQYLPIYWYITLTYCLPFFFTAMTIKNLYSPIWFANWILALYFLILLVDFKSFLILFFTGTFLGVLFTYISPPPELASMHIDYFGIIVTLLISVVIGGIFAHNREKMEQTKLKTMKSVGATIAHELRTPLSAMRFTVSAGKDYMPTLIGTYRLAKEHQLPVTPIQPRHLEVLSGIFEGIEKEIDYSSTIIDMILANAKQNTIATAEIRLLSMSDCVLEALERYPYGEEEHKLVHYNASCNFTFRGDRGLMVHVLFNLLKNSLYYIKKARKGEINLYCDTTTDANYNWLYFRDTGPGIPPEVVPKLFGRFFTTSRHGTGLGLAFCKMVLDCFGGEIRCVSEQGVFTEFRMSFPKIKESG